MFRPQLWPSGEEYWGNPFKTAGAKPQDVHEVWFTGVHGDIGGGYPEGESGLAKVPLKWMIEQTEPTGLHYRAQTVRKIVTSADKGYVAPDPNAAIHKSMNWAWAILEFIPRRRSDSSQRPSLFGLTIPLFERRTIPNGAYIHRSVFDRGNIAGKLSPNIQPDFPIED